VLSGEPGCRAQHFPTSVCHIWQWFRRFHRPLSITYRTSATIVLARIRCALLDQRSRCLLHILRNHCVRHTSRTIVRRTCSQTVSSISIWRHLSIERSLFFCFLMLCQIRALLSYLSPFLAYMRCIGHKGAAPDACGCHVILDDVEGGIVTRSAILKHPNEHGQAIRHSNILCHAL
jgi:hypothetical protein